MRFARVLIIIFVTLIGNFLTAAQSNDVRFPTPLTSGELSGEIKPRVIGDARITNYYYTFNGGQGDIFVNVVTSDLDADIDLFTADALRPLTKIVVLASAGTTETGRLVYLRKPEKIILRISGRASGDLQGKFRIKFGGEFIASADAPADEAPKVTNERQSDVTVNAVGTIIEMQKPRPTSSESSTTRSENDTSRLTVIEDTLPSTTANRRSASKKTPTLKIEKKNESESPAKPPVSPKGQVKKTPVTASQKPSKQQELAKAPDPLTNIMLVVIFKNGKKIERPISEVDRFNVSEGFLTIVTKDGKIGRYSILDVASLTVR